MEEKTEDIILFLLYLRVSIVPRPYAVQYVIYKFMS